MMCHWYRLLAVSASLILARPATAGPITYQFSGTVTVYSPTSSDLPSTIHQGSSATGTFTYDNSAQVLLEPNATFGISDAFSMTPYYYIGINVTSLQQVATTPEPASLILAVLGILGLLGYGWRRA
ncbi:MAG TPA: PEP-CTERM sorting domain-containing protein [Gemmataceae bacterium]|jgi:hypothetical protein|nr:PEP-CTERM sorting domain-containing protein [Gemmataceae bacterium]